MERAKRKAEELSASIRFLADDAQELASLAHLASEEEYRIIREAEQTYFKLGNLIRRALANIKARIEDNSAEALKKFLEEL